MADSHRGNRSAVASMTALVALTVLVTWMPLAGAAFPARVGLSAGSACALWLLSSHGSRRRDGWELLVLTSLPIAAAALALVPLPASVLAVVAPETAQAFPGRVHAISLAPRSTVDQCLVLFGLQALVLVGARSVALASGRRALVAATAALLVAGASGLAHVATGAKVAFGLWAPMRAPDLFLAPHVNPNHAATVALLLGPAAAGLLLHPRSSRSDRVAASVALCMGVGLVLASQSHGALVVAVVQGCIGLVLAGAGWRAALPAGLTGIVGGLALAYRWSQAVEDVVASSIRPRLLQYGDVLHMVILQPIGYGAGAFSMAYPPHKTVPEFRQFDHAHNDWLEWLVGAGVLGLLALVPALWALAKPKSEASRWMLLGLAGFGGHALLSFPVQLPGLAAMAAVVMGLSLGRGRFRHAPPRAIVLVLVALNLFGAGWGVRAELAARAEADALGFRDDPERALAGLERLERLWWRSPTTLLVPMWMAEDRQAAAELAWNVRRAFPENDDALRMSALVLGRAGARERAVETLQRALLRDPTDYRNYWALALQHQAAGNPSGELDARVRGLHYWPLDPAHPKVPLEEAFSLKPDPEWWISELADAPSHWSTMLGMMLLEESPHLALQAHDQAGRIRPMVRTSPERAKALAAVGRVPEAIALLHERAAQYPEIGQTYVVLARVHRAQGDDDLAEAAIRLGLEQTPTSDGLQRALLEHFVSTDQPQSCVTEGRRLLQAGILGETAAAQGARCARDLAQRETCVSLRRVAFPDGESANIEAWCATAPVVTP